MADMTMILPYDRLSPLYIPERNLVLSAADSLWLTVTIVESDDPSAQALVISGGIGGPAAMLVIWTDQRDWRGWDYGWCGSWSANTAGPTTALWTGTGTISDAIGSFEIFIPAATMNTWPLRCRWAVLLDFDGGNQAEMIAQGHLHVRPMLQRSITPTIMLTDATPAVLTDSPVDAIFIAGAPPS